MPDEEEIPYHDPGLREAFRRGWRACVKGKPRPEESLFEGGKRPEAWRKGYEDCGTQDATPD